MLRAILEILYKLFTREPDDDEQPRTFELHDEPAARPPALPVVPDDASDDEADEATTPERVEVVEPEPEPEIEEPGNMKIGAWAGYASLVNPERDVVFCCNNGINRMDVIVNDHSGSRMPRDFDTRKRSMIEKLVKLAQDNGIEVHFMSWVMPHKDYLTQAAEQLVPLCNDLGITSLQWDAEEPWMLAKQAMDYGDAAKHLADVFKDLKCPMGVNGIGYTSTRKFGPLADVCEYVVPQCYATQSSRLDPTTCVPKFVRRYRAKFGADKKVAVGLAAYRQPPPGFTIEGAMSASFAGAEAIENCDAVIYWSLHWIRKSPTITKVIRKLAQKGTLPGQV